MIDNQLFDFGSFFPAWFLDLLTHQYFGNRLWQYLITAFLGAIVFFSLLILKQMVIKKLDRLVKRTSSGLDDVLLKTLGKMHWYVYLLIAAILVLPILDVDEQITKNIDLLALIIITIEIISFLQRLINYFITKQKLLNTDTQSSGEAIKLAGRIAQSVLWFFGGLLIISNLGIDVTSLLAGVGVSGIIVAFALQNVLSDLFSSLSIHFDKPFKVGDFIAFGDYLGTVEKIGVKSVRIRSLSGEELIIPNQDITNERIKNYRSLHRRRVQFSFGVAYSTSNNQLKKIPPAIAKIIDDIELTDFSRAHFASLDSHAYTFEVVYFVNSSDYRTHMDIKQQILLGIKSYLEKEKIDIPFPTQTIKLEK